MLKMTPDLDRFFNIYPWPGNIRELQNVVRYISHLVPPENMASLEHLPGYLLKQQKKPASEPAQEDFSGSNWTTIITELKKQDLLDNVTLILKEINYVSAINKSIGRRSLVKRLHESGSPLSEHTIRSSISMLNYWGMIHSGVTRQGCRITEDGTKFIHLLEKGYE